MPAHALKVVHCDLEQLQDQSQEDYLTDCPLHAIAVKLCYLLIEQGVRFTPEELALRGVDVDFWMIQVKKLEG